MGETDQLKEPCYDVFISYAHIDNEPSIRGNENTCWVTNLRLHLHDRLQKKLGARTEVWMDERDLRAGSLVEEDIHDGVKRSSTLVVIVSPSYLNSDWCRRELESFLEGGGEDRLRRVFMVLTNEINYQQWPAQLQNSIPLKFFEVDVRRNAEQQLGYPCPNPEREPAYFTRINSLASEIASRLEEEPAPADAPGEPGTTVYLASVETELYDEHAALRNFLVIDRGYRVLPEKTYSRVPDDFKQSLEEDLKQSDLFVQLVGRFPGPKPPDLPEGYEGLQLQGARDRKMEILRWRNPALDLAEVANRDKDHALNLKDEVNAMDLENFKDEVVRVVGLVQGEASLDGAHEGGGRYFLISAHESDFPLVGCLTPVLDDLDVKYVTLTEMSRLESAARAHPPDAMLVLYGDASPTWVNDSVMACRDLMLECQPSPVGGILRLPPASERPLLSNPPNFIEISETNRAEVTRILGELAADPQS